MWPQFLRTVSAYFPDPVKEYGLDPDDPATQDTLEKLRVHIDGIKPVWRNNLQSEWFDLLDSKFKTLMHPYDAETAPSGEGWVVQMICHHYNPYPKTRDQIALDVKDPKRTDFGAYQFITEKVLKKLNSPMLRLFGIDHVALAWMTEDREWTTAKGSQNNNLASNTVPLLDRGAPGGRSRRRRRRHGHAGSMPTAMANRMMMGGMSGMQGQQAGGMGMMRGGGMAGNTEMMNRMMGGSGMMGMGKADDDIKKNLKTLNRTDFLIQFVWKPPKPEELPKNDEERQTKLKDISDKMTEAQKNNPAVTIPKQEEIEAVSREKTQQVDSALGNAMGVGGAGGAPGVTPAPGIAPAVAPPAAPPATKKAQ